MDNPIANPADSGDIKAIGRLAECYRRLREGGLSADDFQAPIDDPKMRARLVRFWKSDGHEATTSQKLAHEIMGQNFFGVEEAIQHFKVKPSRSDLAALAEIPFTEANLRERKDSHILVAIFPVSILDIRGKVERPLFCSHKDAWYNKQAFAKDKGKIGWQFIRKTTVENSTNKTWDEQQALLSDKEESPTARVMIYAIIGRFLATGERLFKDIYVRCSDLGSDDGRVGVGYFDEAGLYVDSDWGRSRFDAFLGLAASLKFQTEN